MINFYNVTKEKKSNLIQIGQKFMVGGSGPAKNKCIT